MLRELTGAEDALVVNNNAGALVLVLNTFARGREVVVSRGELVEIGGSFRVPEIIERSGASLREVGSTNRTHASDYRAAIGASTGAVLKVHRSNFEVVGFTADVSVHALRGIAEGVPLVHDLGSGLLLDAAMLELPAEPTVRDAVSAGADIVTFSGDKLLGGPQAGLIVGRAERIAELRRNPLLRALRVDKLTLAGLGATLALYEEPAIAVREIPTLRMLATDAEALQARARRIAGRIEGAGVTAEVVTGASRVGGGAFPAAERPTWLVALGDEGRDAGIERALRSGEPPVIARIAGGRVLLDPRTVAEREEDALVHAVLEACRA